MNRAIRGTRSFAAPAIAVLIGAGNMHRQSSISYAEENGASSMAKKSPSGDSGALSIGNGKDFIPRYPLVPEEDENEEEKQYWKNKRHCSFCTIFLDSPCRQQFKHGSMCVDRCRADDSMNEKSGETGSGDDKVDGGDEEGEAGCDFASHCQESTMALFTCQAANEEYFEPFMKAEEEMRKNREEAEKDVGDNKILPTSAADDSETETKS